MGDIETSSCGCQRNAVVAMASWGGVGDEKEMFRRPARRPIGQPALVPFSRPANRPVTTSHWQSYDLGARSPRSREERFCKMSQRTRYVCSRNLTQCSSMIWKGEAKTTIKLLQAPRTWCATIVSCVSSSVACINSAGLPSSSRVVISNEHTSASQQCTSLRIVVAAKQPGPGTLRGL